jgi:hypothetical protein
MNAWYWLVIPLAYDKNKFHPCEGAFIFPNSIAVIIYSALSGLWRAGGEYAFNVLWLLIKFIFGCITEAYRIIRNPELTREQKKKQLLEGLLLVGILFLFLPIVPLLGGTLRQIAVKIQNFNSTGNFENINKPH